MRAFVWCAVMAVALLCTMASHAADAPPGAAEPDSNTRTDLAVPANPSDIQPPPTPPPPSGVVPTPIAPSKPPTGYVPPATAPVPESSADAVEVCGDQVRTSFDEGKPVLTIAEGNVTARYKDVVATALHARVDHLTEIATFEGNVVFRMGTQEARGDRITFNMRTRQWDAFHAESTIKPEFAQGYLIAPLFAQAAQLGGQGRREFDALGTEATTCNLDLPHYDLVSRSMTLFPNNKIIFRNVTMHALGRTLFTLPRLVIPIRDIYERTTVMPRFGQTLEEGFFAKMAYPYLGTKSQTGMLLLDVMTRKGIGKGLQHNYSFPNARGELQFYQIFDNNINQNTVTGRATHSQRLGSWLANVSTDFRSNSYLYAPQSQSIINQLTLTQAALDNDTSLSVNQNVNNAFMRTSRLAANLQHRRRFGETTSLAAALDYTGFTTGAIGTTPEQTRARLTSQLDFTKREKAFDWNISAQKLTDLSDEAFVGQGGFAGIERLPELGLITDTTRLGKSILPFGVPARLKVTFGEYAEQPVVPSVLERAYIEANTPVQRHNLSDTWTLGAGAGFRQYIYGDNTAQYSIDTSAELTKRLGPTSSFDLTYRFQQPRGFTPFRFDFLGKYNTANAGLNLRDNEKCKLSLLTGYNFEQHDFPWQDVTLRMALQPSNNLLFYTATGYDINQSKWRTLINQVRIRGGDAFRLDLGTRYDTITKRLATVRTVVDAKLGDKTRLQAVAGYNGFTRNFDYRSVMLTRDLHCWEASVVYTSQSGFYQNQGITFNLRIKAFPFFRDFGMGAFGQALDTSVGQVY